VQLLVQPNSFLQWACLSLFLSKKAFAIAWANLIVEHHVTLYRKVLPVMFWMANSMQLLPVRSYISHLHQAQQPALLSALSSIYLL
jgi:hypothetical protein